jgi:hypothetical protein
MHRRLCPITGITVCLLLFCTNAVHSTDSAVYQSIDTQSVFPYNLSDEPFREVYQKQLRRRRLNSSIGDNIRALVL